MPPPPPLSIAVLTSNPACRPCSRSLRLGRWWKKYGYRGPAYCQRCSELFRDHIIRSLSNSARCTLETPCLDCQRILIHFPDGVKQHLCKPQKKPAGPAGARRQQKKAAAAAAAVTPAASLSATTAATDAATS